MILNKRIRLKFIYIFGIVFFTALFLFAKLDVFGKLDRDKSLYFALLINLYFTFFSYSKLTNTDIKIENIKLTNIFLYYLSILKIFFGNPSSILTLFLCLIWTTILGFYFEFTREFLLFFLVFEFLLLLNISVILTGLSTLFEEKRLNEIVWAIFFLSMAFLNIDLMVDSSNLTMLNPLTTLLMSKVFGHSFFLNGILNFMLFTIIIIFIYNVSLRKKI